MTVPPRTPPTAVKTVSRSTALPGHSAGQHRTPGHDDRRDVQARGGHDHARDDLVAVRDHHHGVEGVCAHGDLDGVGDDLTARQRVAHALVVHGDAVAHADRGELHRRAAGHADAGLHGLGDLIEHEMPGDHLVGRIDDGDQRPRDLFVGESVRLEQATVRGPRQALFHATALEIHLLPFFRRWLRGAAAQAYEAGAQCSRPLVRHVTDATDPIYLPRPLAKIVRFVKTPWRSLGWLRGQVRSVLRRVPSDSRLSAGRMSLYSSPSTPSALFG